MVRHKYISNFIRHRFTAPRVAMWNRLSVIDWFIKWLTGKLNGKIQRPCYRALIIDLDKWHTCMHSLPQSDRILFRKPPTDTINFRSISPSLPMTIDCLFQPAQGPLTSEKSTTWFTPTPPFPPLHPSFRTPAHVSFIRHVCGFQGLSERLLFFSHVGPWMNASSISL